MTYNVSSGTLSIYTTTSVRAPETEITAAGNFAPPPGGYQRV